KKFMQLLLPAFVVGAVYALTHDISVTSFLLDGAKYGYWFTFVLFEMYVIYYIVSALSGVNVKIRILMLALVSVVLLGCHKYGIYPAGLDNALCLGNLSYYFVFFACGYAAGVCKSLLCRLLLMWGGVALVLMLAIVSLRNVIPIPSLIVNMSCVCLVVYVVRGLYKDAPNIGGLSAIKRGLVFLGKYTLEIYFLHYFFLFPLPETIGRYFTEISMTSKSHSFPELVVVGGVVAVICMSCIIFSVVLKKIPYISLIAFGKPYKNEA
ncbi:MAG: hypothetical protein K2H14_05970, partial [Muribaculaceae bacterium]|nr:hypothetical protein [Muribaculaceae bacterium]